MKILLLILSVFIGSSIYAQDGSIFDFKREFINVERNYYANQYDSAICKLLNLEKEMEKVDIKDNINDYIRIMYWLSVIYARQNDVKECENTINRAEKTLSMNGLENSSLKRYLILQKGLLRYMIEDIENAKRLFLQSKKMFEKENDVYSEDYVNVLSNLAMTFLKFGNFYFSNVLLNKALKISNKIIDENKDSLKYCIRDNLIIQNNIALNYDLMGDHVRSDSIRNKVFVLAEKYKATDAIVYALINSSYFEILSGTPQNAIKMIERLDGYKLNYNTKDYLLQNYFYSLLLSDDPRIKDITNYYINFIKENLIEVFSTFSESERELFWTQRSYILEFVSNSLCAKYQTPELLVSAFNNNLYSKSMMIRLSKLLFEFVNKNKSKDVKRKYIELVKTKKELSDNYISVDSFSNKKKRIVALEREILSSIESYKDLFNDSNMTWDKIKNNLGDNEAAIEFILIPKITSVQNRDWYYGALIVKSKSKYPILVELCDDKALNEKIGKIKNDNKLINNLYDITNDQLYNLLFSPMEYLLKGIDKIYFSPIGKLYDISLSSISDGNNRLMDRFEFIRLSSTAKLLERKIGNQDIFRDAYVVGGVDYNEDIDDMLMEAKNYNHNNYKNLMSFRGAKRGTWDPIPGSLEEANEINTLLYKNKVKSILYKGKKANEESIKELDGKSPNIIHIATHGFYFDNIDDLTTNYFDSQKSYLKKSLPMKYCGLLLAGANNTWIGKKLPKGIEDGILTAEEIAYLDFSNTKLAVLSACETGLGKVDDIDGVYGLQRGFKMAGVETIVMSLWKVPDDATKELMIEFYKNLMGGKTKHQALNDAKKHLRSVDGGKYNKPEYWASFIMLDGLN